jgi:hypothetical protein
MCVAALVRIEREFLQRAQSPFWDRWLVDKSRHLDRYL